MHNSYEEVFYVLEGEIEYQLGADKVRTCAGDSIFVPPGMPHKFLNVSKDQATHLVVVAPSAAMRMIEELAQVGLDRTAQAEVFSRYDSVLLAE